MHTILCGTLADCNDFSEIEDYGNGNIEFLRSELGFELANGIPSEDTLNRLMRRLKPSELETCLQACLEGLSLAGKHLAIDGKELRGTIPSGKKHALVQVVNLWVDDYKLRFGQVQVDQKSNEITAIPQLLELVNCSQSVISIDTIGCQKEIIAQIRQQQADYVIALKANQRGLYEQVVDFMQKRKTQFPLSLPPFVSQFSLESRAVEIQPGS